MIMTRARPFIKWVGGKSQLLEQFENFYPDELRKGIIKNYVEPFLGGGALFFALSQRYKIESAYLSDLNKDLILTYQVIQQRPNDLLDFLEQYQKDYDQTEPEKRKDLFLTVRRHFNLQHFEINYKKLSDNWIPRAAQLIFLNKTCFNGLFRLNSRGEFNVPYGKYKTAVIFDEPNILAVSKVLQRAEIQQADYTSCFDKVNENTFVYLDPPYRPISQTASFTTYTDAGFDDKEQLQLAQFFRKLDRETGAKLMLSNSDPKNENPKDDFFEKAYSGYNIFRVSASRAVNCNGERRGKINELLVINYQCEQQTLEVNFQHVRNP
ncbi:Dam family site-specific DNA-(adenine-N6)-methyltransferase [Chloracidobacterium aggregatum]|uniref:Site-specific DNA-methyltransferase (adenine-specific) n=1 Tax=Chloracidobacterium sp. N TaxID=2821540 RepID=A0ABX8B2E7_9BACT|nr:Dam family site-specific DNA-(adenine-N6)-methyltransferase [Chloracidobacterium aggregatum]QUV86236.1 Dam family site-specific DNA-(adenine-N6)-methyltransferase [Chloracidobacterium sp. 2]QUV89319.1 Dam family site-specific DNA-(adenine-N6)-methyltransferase [Chloracidobacterium sp. S]QUV92677.1 Dam family site-specific DNA-(adenine-N6)-methyltransferase [Chloracidobacterium sp. A]QUV95153.1 Dam family site-specific DNA-(adenine-N6)-methyltransferase [Chloracidobacterium sp. N]QUV98363.1 